MKPNTKLPWDAYLGASLIVGVAIFVAFLLLGMVCHIHSPGTTTRNGIVQSVSCVGWINKTWEATLIRGGMTGGSGAFAGSYDVTVPDNLSDAFQSARSEGHEVEVQVRIPCVILRLFTDSGHIATGIK